MNATSRFRRRCHNCYLGPYNSEIISCETPFTNTHESFLPPLAHGYCRTIEKPQAFAPPTLEFDFDVLNIIGVLVTQAGALSGLKTNAEGKPVYDLKVLYFVVESGGWNAKDWSDNMCDDVLSSDNWDVQNDGSFMPSTPKWVIFKQQYDLSCMEMHGRPMENMNYFFGQKIRDTMSAWLMLLCRVW